MSRRVQIDANGLRVSKPGYDANGGPAGLLLDTSIRYGQLLDHLLINLNRYQYAQSQTRAATNEGIEYCDGTFYYGGYPETPDVVCVGLVDGRYEYPPAQIDTPTTSCQKWDLRITPGPSSCYVRFDRASGSVGWGVKMAQQAMLLVYRKPRLS